MSDKQAAAALREYLENREMPATVYAAICVAIRKLEKQVVRGRPCVKTRTVQMTGYHEELGTRAADGSTLYRKAMAHVDVPYEYCPVCGATLCSRWSNYYGKCGAKMDRGVDDE